MILESVTVGNLEENCYLLGDPEALFVIDPGDEGQRILSHIHEKGYMVKAVILTHCHFDHVGAVAEIVEATGAELWIGEYEVENFSNRRVSMCGYFSKMPPESKIDKTLRDGEEISSGDFRFRVMHTPGHTEGSLCLFGEEILISGDVLFFESIGRTDFPTGNSKDLVNSIKDKLFALPDSVTVYPGHGPKTTIGHEKKNNQALAWQMSML